MNPDAFYAGTHRSQYDGSALASENCTPTSGANGARASTGGTIDRAGGQIRSLVARNEETNPATPGWSLEDLKLGMSRISPSVPFEIRSGGWSGVVAAHDAGLFVALQGDSDQFGDGTCSGAFDGNHCVGIHPGTAADGTGTWPLADPICPTRRQEKPVTLRAYAEKFGGTSFRFGVFTTPVPLKEADVQITAIKGEDWKPTKNATTGASNGVFRAAPDRAAAVVDRVPLETIVRSIAEVTANGLNWRATERAGQALFMLRSDWAPLVIGGDPATDAQLVDYIVRKPLADIGTAQKVAAGAVSKAAATEAAKYGA
jgi:hypothetical protein